LSEPEALIEQGHWKRARVTAQYSNMLRQLFLARRFKKELDIAIAQDPTDIQALRDLMEFYLLAPGIAGGDKNEARPVAERIARLDAAAGFLAKARLGNEEANLRKAVESQPDSYRARIALASFYLKSNRDLAEQQAREALKIDRSRVDAYNVLAASSAQRANWSAMEAVLGAAEKEVPDDLTPYYRAAEAIAASHHDLPRAEGLLRRYLATEPEGNAPTRTDAQRLVAAVR
jgi:Tfp pilus assembly protein PilF